MSFSFHDYTNRTVYKESIRILLYISEKTMRNEVCGFQHYILTG